MAGEEYYSDPNAPGVPFQSPDSAPMFDPAGVMAPNAATAPAAPPPVAPLSSTSGRRVVRVDPHMVEYEGGVTVARSLSKGAEADAQAHQAEQAQRAAAMEDERSQRLAGAVGVSQGGPAAPPAYAAPNVSAEDQTMRDLAFVSQFGGRGGGLSRAQRQELASVREQRGEAAQELEDVQANRFIDHAMASENRAMEYEQLEKSLGQREEAYKVERQAKQEAMEDYQQRIEQKREELAETEIDPGRMFSGETGAPKIIAAALFSFIEAYGASKSGQPSAAASIIQNAIDRDIEAQKEQVRLAKGNISEMRSTYATMLKEFGDAETAEAAAREQLWQGVDLRLKQYESVAQSQDQLTAAAELRKANQVRELAAREQGLLAAQKRGGSRSREKLAKELLLKNRDAQAKAGESKDSPAFRQQIGRYGKEMAEIANLEEAINEAERAMNSSDDVSGIGPLGGRVNPTVEATTNRMAVQNLANLDIKQKTGAGMSVEEAKRLVKGSGLDTTAREDVIRAGIKARRAELEAKKASLAASVDPEVVEVFNARKGNTGPQIDFTPGGQ